MLASYRSVYFQLLTPKNKYWLKFERHKGSVHLYFAQRYTLGQLKLSHPAGARQCLCPVELELVEAELYPGLLLPKLLLQPGPLLLPALHRAPQPVQRPLHLLLLPPQLLHLPAGVQRQAGQASRHPGQLVSPAIK